MHAPLPGSADVVRLGQHPLQRVPVARAMKLVFPPRGLSGKIAGMTTGRIRGIDGTARQLAGGELTDHRVHVIAAGAVGAQQRTIDQGLQRDHAGARHGLRCRTVEATAADRQLGQGRLTRFVEQHPRMFEHRRHAAVARRHVVGCAGQQRDVTRKLCRDLSRRHRPRPGGRKFDSQRQPFGHLADTRHRREGFHREIEIGPDATAALRKKLHGRKVTLSRSTLIDGKWQPGEINQSFRRQVQPGA